MKNWKGYNIIDLMLILSGVIVVSITSIVFRSSWYVFLNTMFGLFCVFTQAKGKIITQFLGVIWFSFYISISYSQKYYGEVILYLIILLPLYIYGIIHWLKNRDGKENSTVLVRGNLSKKEWMLSFAGFILVSCVSFFVLKRLGTKQLIISTLSFISMLPAVYLLVRRCKWNQVAFLVNDFVVPLLWITLVIEGDSSFVAMCVYHLFQMTYDIYGFIEWVKLEKKQKRIENKAI